MRRPELTQLVSGKLQTGKLHVAGSSSSSNSSGADSLPTKDLTLSPPRKNVPNAGENRPDLLAQVRAAALWAQVSTNADLQRADDIRRDKLRAVREFLGFIEKDLLDVTPLDVQQWQTRLERRGLKATTVYTYCAHLSGFFEWLRRQPELRLYFSFNPVRAAFPKCPAAYQSKGTRSLTDQQLAALWQAVETEARAASLVGLRDYAIFLFFAATGARRSEILNLEASDIELLPGGGLIYYPRAKGGERSGKTLDDGEVRAALLEYLMATGRGRRALGKCEPLWLAHDNAAPAREEPKVGTAAGGKTKLKLIVQKPAGSQKLKPLSSRAFAYRMKVYAARAGLAQFHLHQLRHTFARVVAEEAGSLSAAQEALGHRNLKTTAVYVRNVSIRADQHSSRLKSRIKGNLG